MHSSFILHRGAEDLAHLFFGGVAPSRIRTLDPEVLVWGVACQTTEPGRTDHGEVGVTRTEEAAAVSLWIELYFGERKHLLDICKTAIGCGIAERQVRLAEAHGEIIANVLKGVLSDPWCRAKRGGCARGVAAPPDARVGRAGWGGAVKPRAADRTW